MSPTLSKINEIAVNLEPGKKHITKESLYLAAIFIEGKSIAKYVLEKLSKGKLNSTVVFEKHLKVDPDDFIEKSMKILESREVPWNIFYIDDGDKSKMMLKKLDKLPQLPEQND